MDEVGIVLAMLLAVVASGYLVLFTVIGAGFLIHWLIRSSKLT